jgi:hypothetical protein
MNTHASWAGVQDRYTNVTGIALWRQNQVLDTEGLDAALRCAFGDLLGGAGDLGCRARHLLGLIADLRDVARVSLCLGCGSYHNVCLLIHTLACG